MTDNIIRVSKTGNYAVISNEPLEDERLSWEAKGVLAYLLTKPNDWVVRNYDLEKKGKAGDFKMRRILAELKSAGYMTRQRCRNADGSFYWETIVYEKPAETTIPRFPTNGLPTRGLPTRGSPISGKARHLTNTESLNTESLSTESLSTDLSAGENPPAESEIPDAVYLEQEESVTLTGASAWAILAPAGLKGRTAKALANSLKAAESGKPDYSSYPESVRAALECFTKASGINPVKSERSYWIKVALEWQQLGLTGVDIKAAIDKMRSENLVIGNPGSVTKIARDLHSNGGRGTQIEQLERQGLTYGGN